jgi:adenylate cyclase
MLDDLRAFKSRHQLPWYVRIGLKSGPVIGGIIGTKKFAYDLWCDTVNLGSRMESQGQPGRIQITTTTRALLDDKFQTQAGGVIDIKNTGLMQVFHLIAPAAA